MSKPCPHCAQPSPDYSVQHCQACGGTFNVGEMDWAERFRNLEDLYCKERRQKELAEAERDVARNDLHHMAEDLKWYKTQYDSLRSVTTDD